MLVVHGLADDAVPVESLTARRGTGGPGHLAADRGRKPRVQRPQSVPDGAWRTIAPVGRGRTSLEQFAQSVFTVTVASVVAGCVTITGTGSSSEFCTGTESLI